MKDRILAAAAAACILASCGGGGPKRFTGVIEEASMNTVAVKSLTDDKTVLFSTADADMAEAHGLLQGNIATVEYTGKLREATPAVKVVTDATYAKAVGEWTMPDSIAPESVRGVKLLIEGEAESVNLATLRYASWELQGEADKIVLRGESEGAGRWLQFTQTAVLGTNAEGRETLSIEGTEIVLTKQTE